MNEMSLSVQKRFGHVRANLELCISRAMFFTLSDIIFKKFGKVVVWYSLMYFLSCICYIMIMTAAVGFWLLKRKKKGNLIEQEYEYVEIKCQ